MDILSTLRQPLSMSMFRNSDDLFAEMALQRQLAATEIESLRSRAEKAEAERDEALAKVLSKQIEQDRYFLLKAETAEATCEKLAKALDQCQKALASMIDPSSIAQTTVIYAFATATTAEATARHVLAAYRKEASE